MIALDWIVLLAALAIFTALTAIQRTISRLAETIREALAAPEVDAHEARPDLYAPPAPTLCGTLYRIAEEVARLRELGKEWKR
jgi:hypothetical protein